MQGNRRRARSVRAQERAVNTRVSPLGHPGKLLHRNPWFAVRNRGGYFTVEHHLQQVVVLPVVERRAAVMVRVRRPILGDITLELPAGGADKQETPREGAARELAEETGIRVDANRIVPGRSLSLMPNRTADFVSVFHVELSQDEYNNRAPHDREIETVELIPLADVPRLIRDRSIYLALPVAVLSTFLLVDNGGIAGGT